jgi:hypothetical protein
LYPWRSGLEPQWDTDVLSFCVEIPKCWAKQLTCKYNGYNTYAQFQLGSLQAMPL